MASSPTHRDLLEACRSRPPRIAIVLGSGLGDLAERLEHEIVVPFGALSGLEPPSVAGHQGEVRLGPWAGQRVLVFLGRLHYYEGHPWRRVEEQVHLAKELGVEILLLTNAAGGIHDDLLPGSMMPICDHLEWTRAHPWRHPGPNTRLSPYSPRLLALLNQAAGKLELSARPGVYAQVTGPCYETPAEIRALRACGADAVGMSTCREIIRGQALGLECAAVSCITNRAAGLAAAPIHHGEVIEMGAKMRDGLGRLVEEFLLRLV
jgi:purine-nucleoside phosphorylase